MAGTTHSAQAIQAAVTAVARYDYGQRRTPLVALEKLINATYGDREARTRMEAAMVELLDSNATVAAKQFVCKKLWIMGTAASIPALEKLLVGSDPVLAEAACYALRTQESELAGAALRRAIAKAKGTSLAAIVTLLGDKRDAAAVSRIGPVCMSEDEVVSSAAIAALGKIASPDAVDALSQMHQGQHRGRRANASHALLQCGQELEKRRELAAARRVYGLLTGDSEASHVRRGAQAGVQRCA